MKPDLDQPFMYHAFGQEYGWLPSEVDDEDAVIVEKLLVIIGHRNKLMKK